MTHGSVPWHGRRHRPIRCSINTIQARLRSTGDGGCHEASSPPAQSDGTGSPTRATTWEEARSQLVEKRIARVRFGERGIDVREVLSGTTDPRETVERLVTWTGPRRA